MKRLLSIVAVVLICVPVTEIAATQGQRGIVWQIERKGLEPSYIMGTVHSDDDRVLRLPEQVRSVFRKASSFVAELKLDHFSIQQAAKMMFDLAGPPLESVIGQQRYQACIRLLAGYGIPEAQLQHMKPWAVAVSLSMPKSRSGVVLDIELYQQAQSQGKKLFGLETAHEQVAVFETLTLQQQLSLLDDAIKQHHKLSSMFEELVQYYLQRDLNGLERASNKYMMQGDRLLAQNLIQKVLLDRNYRMVRRMQPRLQEGNSFIAVGALHLPGEEGILRLLEKQGYTVTAIY